MTRGLMKLRFFPVTHNLPLSLVWKGDETARVYIFNGGYLFILHHLYCLERAYMQPAFFMFSFVFFFF